MYLSVIRTAALLIAAAALASCGNSGDPAPVPKNVSATPGDGRVVLSWDAVVGEEYWIFGAADASVDTENWTSLPESLAMIRGLPPQPICALNNGTDYWLTLNARTGTAEGGPGSAAVNSTPRVAGDTWTTSTLGSEINGLGFAISTLCRTVNAGSDTDRPATGRFVALGNGASIYTSTDGANWTQQSTPTASGFTSDLHGVTVNTGNPGSSTDLRQLWIAVGAESAALRSTDGLTWTVGLAPLGGSGTLRSVTHNFLQFIAVGDGGRIRWTSDGINWFDRNSPTSSNLLAVAFDKARYIAVGENGTLLMSGDSAVWNLIAVGTSAHLRGVAYGNNNANPGNNNEEEIDTWVAVGDAGTVLTSTNAGSNWTAQTLPGAPNLVGVGYTTQFIALDAVGAVWRSIDGVSWTGPTSSGLASVKAVNGLSQYGVLSVSPGGKVSASF